MRRKTALSLTIAFVASLLTMFSPIQRATADHCHPITEPPRYMNKVPTGEEVLGFELGSQEVTTAQSDAYLQAVDDASDRVVTGTLATSQEGRPLRYAIIGNKKNVTDDGLRRIRQDVKALRDPYLSNGQARRIVASSPAILWVASNVHGGEESGTDASLVVLYDLADRKDCAARRILDNSIVVLLPVQNPDGREADTRRNHYGFDMNRDWFARTQPETDGKVRFLRKYPGPLFIDAHEMGADDYFFPPNADPVYHEITDESIDWINNTYGAAMAREFERQGIPYFNRDIYDLFYMGYGDTVPSTGFISAGMTFEKSSGDPIEQRTYEQYVTQWISLSQGARHRKSILTRWHNAWVEAFEQGVAGRLEPNKIINPGNEVETEVPETRVRHYFIRNEDPTKADEVQELVRRLIRMDVKVYRLSRPVVVPNYHEYAQSNATTTLPPGTYWVPMAQAQKHWVQAMLNEDTYTPFPYFYDVTAWSNPLLMNLSGGFTGANLQPNATRVRRMAKPDGPEVPAEVPTVAVYQISTSSTSSIESTGWLRWLFERKWELPYRDITASEIAAGGLATVDVLIVPHGEAQTAYDDLGPQGRQAIVDWVNTGGRYIGWRRGGAPLASMIGISTAQFAEPTSDVPGSLFHVDVDQTSPLAAAVGALAWSFYEYDLVMMAADPADVVVKYPNSASPNWFVSGFADGEEELGDTAAVIDEAVGLGRSIVFSFEPNFRGFTDGTQQLVWNAVLGPNPVPAHAPRAGAAVRADDEAAARVSTLKLLRDASAIRLSVRPSDAGEATAIVDRYTDDYTVQRSPGRISFAIANRRGLSADEHSFVRDLARDLVEADVATIAFKTP
ncbi:MAG: M14 family zinc carboxypeptidase [Actinomycetota bacterium]